MRIALKDLATDRLDLDLGNDRVIELADLKGLAGTIERSGPVMQLYSMTIEGAVLERLNLPLPTGNLSTASPATLRGLQANVDVRADAQSDVPPFTGTIRGAQLQSKVVTLELAIGANTLKVTGDLDGSGIDVVIGSGSGQVVVATIALRNVQLMFAGAIACVNCISADNLRVSWGGGKPVSVVVDAGELGDVQLRYNGSDIKLGTIVLPAGFSLGDNAVAIPAIHADDIDAIVANLDRNKDRNLDRNLAPDNNDTERKDTNAPLVPTQPSPAPLVDWTVLDQLNGRVNVDVTLVAVVPVIGTRDATHKFRVPVSEGIINYSELEDDLSALEDAFIDFAVRGQTLVIERDIPIIPGLNKPIVIWDLNADEIALAKRKLVRLRTLANPRLAGASEDNGNSSFELKRLRVANVDVELSLQTRGEDATKETTSVRELSLGKLLVAGVVDHMPHVELEPTPIEIDMEALAATVHDLAIGKLRVNAHVQIAKIQGAIITMAGLQPSGLSGRIGGVGITGLRVNLP